MKISKAAQKMADDLGLTAIDAYMMELKSKLYTKCAESIKSSTLTHEEIAKSIGTSRARISRLANMGENSVSMEILIKLIAVLENKEPIKIGA